MTSSGFLENSDRQDFPRPYQDSPCWAKSFTRNFLPRSGLWSLRPFWSFTFYCAELNPSCFWDFAYRFSILAFLGFRLGQVHVVAVVRGCLEGRSICPWAPFSFLKVSSKASISFDGCWTRSPVNRLTFRFFAS